MAIQTREKKKDGVKFMVYGKSGTGKSPFGLSFPKQFLFDPDSSTTFYDGENVLRESTAMSFSEALDDFNALDRDKKLLSSVETISIDSVTRYVERQEQAALKVAENRAMNNGRDVEGESISPKERNVMKLNYERFFSRLMGYVKRGKNIYIIAEQKEKTENKVTKDGGTTFVKVGDIPNMPKDSDYDFDVIIRTYHKEDGIGYGIVEKDRTRTFKIGDEIREPNYSHWEAAINRAQQGVERSESEIKTLDEVIEGEVKSFNNPDADTVEELHGKMKKILIDIKDQEFKDNNIAPKMREILVTTVNFLSIRDVQKLEKAHKMLEEKYEEYKDKNKQ